jgi:Tol biopolymer transport system component
MMASTNRFRISVVAATLIAAGLLVALVAATRPAEAAFPGTNGPIVFASDRVTATNPTGDFEIFTMTPEGTDVTQLTNNTALDYDPAWNPGGTQIAFHTNRDGGNLEIYTMEANGDNPTRLTNNGAFDGLPAWSPDGTQIAFQSTRDANSEIYKMDTVDSDNDDNGDNPTRLTNNGAFDSAPAWSPNGKIAFYSERDGDREIFVMRANGSRQTRLTKNLSYEDSFPSWSPNGKKIAFASNRINASNQDGDFEIFVMNADGTRQRNRTKNTVLQEGAPVFSPDGTQIAYESSDGDREIFTMDANGSNQTNRTSNTTANDDAPDWQPIPSP